MSTPAGSPVGANSMCISITEFSGLLAQNAFVWHGGSRVGGGGEA